MLQMLALGISGGFLLAFFTGLLLSTDKARKLAGGSLAMGFAIASQSSNHSVESLVLGAIGGLIGWGIYALINKK